MQGVGGADGRKRWRLSGEGSAKAMASCDVSARDHVQSVAQARAFVVESRPSLIEDVLVETRRTWVYGGGCWRFLTRTKVLRSPWVLSAHDTS